MHFEWHVLLVNGLDLQIGLRPARGKHGLSNHPREAADSRDDQ
jgi:hypothetical protein